LALYLFLVTVGDAEGLSYYGDSSIAGWLSVDPSVVPPARRELLSAGLIAYARPLYQVLALDPECVSLPTRTPQTAPLALREVLAQMKEARA
jgi:hypothetical protein